MIRVAFHPRRGLSAVLGVFAAFGLRAGDHLIEERLSLGLDKLALGQDGESETVFGAVCHASNKAEEQPVGAVPAVKEACDGMGEAAGSHKLAEDAQLACDGGNFGVVADELRLIGKADHVDEAAHVALLCNSQPEAQAEKAAMAA